MLYSILPIICGQFSSQQNSSMYLLVVSYMNKWISEKNGCMSPLGTRHSLEDSIELIIQKSQFYSPEPPEGTTSEIFEPRGRRKDKTGPKFTKIV